MILSILSKIQIPYIAEFFGTGLLFFFGSSYMASTKLIGITLSYWEVSSIWGMGVTVAMYCTINISGAHLNPAVTIAFWLFSNFPKYKVLPYIISQILGSFFASAFIYYLYNDLFFDYEQIHYIIRNNIEGLELASIFSTYPHPDVSMFKAFILETMASMILLFFILVLTNDNNRPYYFFIPSLVGILIMVISISIGPLTGAALNPARDFGPKTFAFLAGWGKIAYTGGRNIPYFLIPLISPIIGACLGAYIYNRYTK